VSRSYRRLVVRPNGPAVRHQHVVAVSSAAGGGVRRVRPAVGPCRLGQLQPGRVPVRVQVQFQTAVFGAKGRVRAVLGVWRK